MMTIIFLTISIGVLFVYTFNLFIMIKKGKKEQQIEQKEFADDPVPRKGIEAFFTSHFAKIHM
jgi:hypothetical protein